MKFKEGDLVAIYTGEGRFVGTVKRCCPKEEMLQVSLRKTIYQPYVHPKQCRSLRLVKKKERIWLTENEIEKYTRRNKIALPGIGRIFVHEPQK